MAKLTAKSRNALPARDFAVAGGRYPIEDASHARNALARSSGKPEAAQVRAAVAAKYPGISVTRQSPKHGRPR